MVPGEGARKQKNIYSVIVHRKELTETSKRNGGLRTLYKAI